MTTTPQHLSADQVEALAVQDAREICTAASTLTASDLTEGRYILVCGDWIAPSMRALPSGDLAWRLPDVDGLSDAWTIYVEAFDRVTDAYEHPSGAFLSWEEGNLFLALPESE